jgi:hypothetical protein
MKAPYLATLGLVLAGCASEAVSTPDQARAIALASVCAQHKPILAPNEQMPAQWLAERRGDRWFVWLPFGQGAQLPGGNGQFPYKYGHMGAWVNAKDGKILYCEGGGAPL